MGSVPRPVFLAGISRSQQILRTRPRPRCCVLAKRRGIAKRKKPNSRRQRTRRRSRRARTCTRPPCCTFRTAGTQSRRSRRTCSGLCRRQRRGSPAHLAGRGLRPSRRLLACPFVSAKLLRRCARLPPFLAPCCFAVVFGRGHLAVARGHAAGFGRHAPRANPRTSRTRPRPHSSRALHAEVFGGCRGTVAWPGFAIVSQHQQPNWAVALPRARVPQGHTAHYTG